MTARELAGIAALGSLVLLGGALAFQYFGGLHPCKMCIWQRWPHGLAIAFGALFLLTEWRPSLILGGVSAFATAGIGLFHAGVEQAWWDGPTTCSAGDISGLSSEELLNQILAAPVVRCDEIAWAFGGISMAGWNALFSLVLVAFWAWSFMRFKSA